MINDLKWDSKFFGRKIGELEVDFESFLQIEADVKKAKDDGYSYIICKLQSQQTDLLKVLESLGFYLSDIGVTWAAETDRLLNKSVNKDFLISNSTKVANDKDIPVLKEIVKSLFPESRFYNDPFFSKEDADNLYQTWIENSVKGSAADIVLFIPDKGLITCRKSKSDEGRIVLVGVKKDFRGKSIGTVLTNEAVKWFNAENVNTVILRTQLKNLNAMNFYNKLGFYIKGYDLIFAKIL